MPGGLDPGIRQLKGSSSLVTGCSLQILLQEGEDELHAINLPNHETDVFIPLTGFFSSVSAML